MLPEGPELTQSRSVGRRRQPAGRARPDERRARLDVRELTGREEIGLPDRRSHGGGARLIYGRRRLGRPARQAQDAREIQENLHGPDTRLLGLHLKCPPGQHLRLEGVRHTERLL